jgi:hypothetical protein
MRIITRRPDGRHKCNVARYYMQMDAEQPGGQSYKYVEICTAEDLYNMRYSLANKFCLGADIDLTAYANWPPIGTVSAPFTGELNGMGHTITALTIRNETDDHQGLFGYCEGARLEDISLDGVSLTIGTNQEIGSLCGYMSSGTIKSVHVINATNIQSITAGYLGGILGAGDHMVIEDCTFNGSLVGDYWLGGIAGRLFDGDNRVRRCSSTGFITAQTALGKEWNGGILGELDTGLIEDCRSDILFMGYEAMGGIAGCLCGAKDNAIARCHFVGTMVYLGEAVGEDQFIGGILGEDENWDTRGDTVVTNSFWDSEASGATLSHGGTGKTTANMKKQATFTGWDFTNTWTITEDTTYPTLR